MSTPYIGFSNDTLSKLPRAKAGDSITCPLCSQPHVLEAATVAGKPSDLLLFYQCGAKTYLAGVDGRLTINQPSDVSGSL